MKQFLLTVFIGACTLPVLFLILNFIAMLAIKPAHLFATILLVLLCGVLGGLMRLLFEDTFEEFYYWLKKKWRNRRRNDR